MEPGVPYRINTNGKPENAVDQNPQDDENKLLMVTVFRVVQLKDEKTGGVRPVGGLVKDYKLGGNRSR